MASHHETGQYRIGTSGWSYADWQDVFYPKRLSSDAYLSFYAEQFNTVELNNTFYHLPKITAVRHWAETVPQDFLFAIKGSRYISHIKRLNIEPVNLQKMFEPLEPLKEKMGPILFQLPANFHPNMERLQRFIHLLPRNYRYAFEFRNPAWFEMETYQVLTEANIACCTYDFEGFSSPAVLTADFAYLRFHGPRKKPYVGRYSKSFLLQWQKTIQQWLKNGVDVYCYFDNTADGAAVHDAQELRQRLTPQKQHQASLSSHSR